MSRARFEELVTAAMDAVPAELAALVDNCVVLVEDDPPADDPDLLGRVRRDAADRARRRLHDGAAGPDHDLPAARRWRCARPRSEVVEEVRITVVHEIAHHFGIDDDRLHDLGYA